MRIPIQITNCWSIHRVRQFLNKARDFGVDRLVDFLGDLLSFLKRAFSSDSFDHGSDRRAISVNTSDLSSVSELLN